MMGTGVCSERTRDLGLDNLLWISIPRNARAEKDVKSEVAKSVRYVIAVISCHLLRRIAAACCVRIPLIKVLPVWK